MSKYLFIVQGEGRGHLSQAIALKEIIVSAGHSVDKVFVGKSKTREIPSYFFKHFKNTETYYSPNFSRSHDKKGIYPLLSLFVNFFMIFKYLKSIRFLFENIKKSKPDCVINFYEPLVGLTYMRFNLNTKCVSMAHHFLHNHPEFPSPKGWRINKLMMRCLNKITAHGSEKVLALSFTEYPPFKNEKYIVMPPLLRNKILKSKPEKKGFLLGYMLNEGYAKEVLKWHEDNKDIKVDIFWDKKCNDDHMEINENLDFHKLDDMLFINKLLNCDGVITTSGFESVCEALYLNKPVVVVPVKNHYEQLCNAVDAASLGVVTSKLYSPEKLINLIRNQQKNKHENTEIKNWVSSSSIAYLDQLTNI